MRVRRDKHQVDVGLSSIAQHSNRTVSLSALGCDRTPLGIAPEPPTDRSLVFRPTTRPLSEEERAFNRALARVKTLSQGLEKESRQLDALLVFHAAEIQPRQAGPTEVARLDAQLVVLGEALDRLATDRALDEVRGAILEYQATRKRWVMPRLRRQRGRAARR